jgi:hypothetical protein
VPYLGSKGRVRINSRAFFGQKLLHRLSRVNGVLWWRNHSPVHYSSGPLRHTSSRSPAEHMNRNVGCSQLQPWERIRNAQSHECKNTYTNTIKINKKMNTYFRLERTCLAFIGCGDVGLFHQKDCSFVFGS